MNRRTFLLSSAAAVAFFPTSLPDLSRGPVGMLGPIGPIGPIGVPGLLGEAEDVATLAGNITVPVIYPRQQRTIGRQPMTEEARDALNRVTDELEKLRAVVERIDDEDAIEALEEVEEAMGKLRRALSEGSRPETA